MKKITYRECLRVLDGLNNFRSFRFEDLKDIEKKEKFLPSGKFLYGVSKNKRMLEEIQKDLFKIVEKAEDYEKFLSERDGINKNYALKDENGQYIITTTIVGGATQPSYSIPGINDVESSYNKEIENLKEKYAFAIEEMDEKIHAYNKQLDLESEFNPFLISANDVPEGLSEKTWDALIYILKPNGE